MYFFPLPAGANGVLPPGEGTEIVGFALEANLRDPFPLFPVPVYAGISAGVVCVQTVFSCLQHGDGGAVDQFQIFPAGLRLAAAAAFCFSCLQQRLSGNRFLSAVADAFPAVHTSLFPGISRYR